MAKTWKQKLEGGMPPHIEVLEKPFGGGVPGSRMLVSSPREVDSFIRQQPRGTQTTVAQLRLALAASHGADLACLISSGLFIKIAAEAALDELANGIPFDEVTPFWRVIDPASPLASKLSCGPAFIEAQRSAEAVD